MSVITIYLRFSIIIDHAFDRLSSTVNGLIHTTTACLDNNRCSESILIYAFFSNRFELKQLTQ